MCMLYMWAGRPETKVASSRDVIWPCQSVSTFADLSTERLGILSRLS